MELGIIGKSRSGKTSLFNAVTRGTAQVGAYSAGTEPNIGVVKVPDPRLDALADVFKPKKLTHAEIRWVDFPAGSFGKDAPGAQFLAQIAKADALVHVVRAFEDASVPHPDGGAIDPHGDIEALDLELAFSDLALIERRVHRIDVEMRAMKPADRPAMDTHQELLRRMQAHLETGAGLRSMTFSDVEDKELRAYQFVTRLPVLLIVNIGEDDVAKAAEIEAELSQMDPDDASAFRADLGLAVESPLDRAIVNAYGLLGLQSFLTAGEDEVRAWTVRKGASAPEAAGKIHTDLERGFIRAEVAGWRDYVDAKGSNAELKKAGKLRTEGKQYIVQDGDVVNILFNV